VTYQLEPEDEVHAALVHQAVGIVSVQADCELAEAFLLLTARAKSTGVPVHTIALAVVTDVLRFDDRPS
jgi:hypothetical protein